MLDKIYYINLESATNRNKKFLEYMSDKMDVEGVILERFNAHDGRDWTREDTREDLIVAAANEFPCFNKLWYSSYNWFKRGSIACCWSYLECLRLIEERDEVALILYDDQPLGRPVSDVVKILETLSAEVDKFHVLQLKWFSDSNNFGYSSQKHLRRDTQICLGLSGIGDTHNVYSRKGADWFIDAFSLVPQMFEWHTNIWSKVVLPGFYSLDTRKNGFGGYIENDVQERQLIDALE